PHGARKHRAADHHRRGHQHAGRARSRRDPAQRRRDPRHRRQAGARAGGLGRPRRGTHRRRPAAMARQAPDHQPGGRMNSAAAPAAADVRRAASAGRTRAVHAAPIVNALTIDVEDYFQVSAFAPYIPRGEWDTRECRVERNIDTILALLDDAGARATVFTLGWIAERHPRVVRRIVDGGHELASHGYAHRRATEQSPELFLADIKLAKVILEDLADREVKGYRAPSFSIGTANPWAFDAIRDAGYRYSSSVYPIRHDH